MRNVGIEEPSSSVVNDEYLSKNDESISEAKEDSSYATVDDSIKVMRTPRFEVFQTRTCF